MIQIISYLIRRRRLRRHSRDALRAARHVLNMREDVMSASDAAGIRAAADRLKQSLESPDFGRQTPPAIEALGEILARVAPARPASVAREYVEVLVVAVSVAVGFKTYFFQPFKIPTGSMQPTLYGVHANTDTPKPFVHLNAGQQVRFLRLPSMDINGFSERTIFTGERYVEIRALNAGTVGLPSADQDPTVTVLPVGNTAHRLPVGPSESVKNDIFMVRPGELIEKGTVLCRITSVAGDHVLVNRMALNFRRPRRDDVIVFSTRGIEGLLQGTHYIKRLVGLPGEQIGIQQPNLMVNGKPARGYRGIDRVTESPGQGYRLPHSYEGGKITTTNDHLSLGPREYAGFGDNTSNSKDSRYWGAIPEENLVGPAVFVYWPFSRRWGLIR